MLTFVVLSVLLKRTHAARSHPLLARLVGPGVNDGGHKPLGWNIMEMNSQWLNKNIFKKKKKKHQHISKNQDVSAFQLVSARPGAPSRCGSPPLRLGPGVGQDLVGGLGGRRQTSGKTCRKTPAFRFSLRFARKFEAPKIIVL